MKDGVRCGALSQSESHDHGVLGEALVARCCKSLKTVETSSVFISFHDNPEAESSPERM